MKVSFFRRYYLTIWYTVVISKVYGQQTADWMSGKHGVGFRIPGGVNQETAIYDVDELVNQIKNEIPEVTWILLGLSSGAYGDRYNSPHTILTDLNRASTPRQTENVNGLPGWFEINANGLTNFTLEDYPDRDLYSEIANALHAEGFKIIAYMASQGPTFLKHDETRAYDYDSNSYYVDSIAECNILTNGDITDGKCSPSARRWRNHVISVYGNDDESTLKQAYVELILREYVNKFDGKEGRPLIDGWWFDQGIYLDIPRAYAEIKAANPNATIAFNAGQKIPLANNNPPYEDYTAGHPNPITQTPPFDEINEDIIISIEGTSDGYFESQGSYSLGHAFQMTNDAWNNGELVWDGDKLPQAINWMSRVVNAKGAWTWNVKRSFYPTKLHEDDITLLKDIYAGVSQTTPVPSVRPSDPISSASPSNPIPCSSSVSGVLEDIGGNPVCLLQECQGDCDTDDDCDGNLFCLNRDDDTAVPGCTGTPYLEWDYCISPTTQTPIVSPTSQAPTISPTTQSPTISPTTLTPTFSPSISPTVWPSGFPTETTTTSPSRIPSTTPTYMPTSLRKSSSPSNKSLHPSPTPSALPSLSPTVSPSGFPTEITTTSPSSIPSTIPSAPITPTSPPLVLPSVAPIFLTKTLTPSAKPSQLNSTPPISVSLSPSGNPTTQEVLPTSNPSIHQSILPTSVSCAEDPDDLFLFKLIDDEPKSKSCSWLSEQPIERRTKVCLKQKSYGQYKQPAIVCKLTCASECPPTMAPSLSLCEEASDDMFLLKMNKEDKPIVKSCNWLTFEPSKRQSRICQQQTGFGEYEKPADVCKLTCGIGCTPTNAPSVSSLAPTITCDEDLNDIFVYKIKPSGPKTRTCSWLSDLMNQNIKRGKAVCAKGLSYGNIGSAADICPRTCQTCTPIEPTPAPTGTCVQKFSDEFFHKLRKNDSTPIIKSCQWLDFIGLNDANKVKKICKSKERYDDFLPARKVCRRTCKTCK